MSAVAPLDELIDRFGRLNALGLPLVDELQKLKKILPHDFEMAIVRGRRIVDLIVRALYSKRISPSGTRPLEQLLPDLEKQGIMPREVVAHIVSLKAVANLCAHEGTDDQEGLEVCLINLVVVLKWFARYTEAAQGSSPVFRGVDGSDVQDRADFIIREILKVDQAVFREGDEQSFGCFERSQTWFHKNPQIYSLLLNGSQLVGYSNVMPLEDEAWDLVIKGGLQDGLVPADAIRRYELPGMYRVYICCFAILNDVRHFPSAFGTLYDLVFEKFFRLADSDIFISEIAANAWTAEGRSLCKSFGMSYVCPHCKHGEVYQSTIIPPKTVSPSRKLRLLLDRYKEMGLV